MAKKSQIEAHPKRLAGAQQSVRAKGGGKTWQALAMMNNFGSLLLVSPAAALPPATLFVETGYGSQKSSSIP